MNDEQIAEMLGAGEQRSVEFKSGNSLDDGHFVAVLARAVLAMTNKRDGGRVVVGAEDDGTSSGISTADFTTWNHDHLRDKLAAYSDPFVSFEVEEAAFQGTTLIVLHVAEFEEVPVICKKTYDSVLREGTVYVRGRRKPESIPIASHADMRELIDLATEKAVARFNRLREAAGPSDTELFRVERSKFFQ